ncbi:unnamed protein product [Hymenolepis diminuta]|uniref:BLOC-1-related complex subunit 5 n=1 Tax=Hymenolepis diminuta TaxID=6216 RepID=A0A0R3SFQ2_HYMDI|nr:unnamed protein product [Hymenolepis diminuta]
MTRNQINGPVGVEMPPIKRLPRFAVSPYFIKEAEMNISPENLRMPTQLSPKLEAPLKSSALQTPETPRKGCDGSLSPRSSDKNRYSLGSLSPLHEALSPRRSPPLSQGFKTFHAPKSNQVYAVPVARTFDPTRIDTLIATLAEKLISLRARSDIIASNIDYTSKLIREINTLGGRN